MSNSNTLLAHMVAKLTPQGEDAATNSLAFVLNKSVSCREAFDGLLRSDGFELDGIDHLKTQVVDADGSRPDMIGYSSEGSKVLVVEAKFWAELRDTQVTGYLAQLEKDTPSVLLFVVPERRISTLWVEVCRQFENGDVKSELTPITEVGRYRSASISDSNNRLMLVSWALLLERLDAATANEPIAKSDVQQLRGLAASQDESAFLPLHSSDFSASKARRLIKFWQVVEDVIDARGLPGDWLEVDGGASSFARANDLRGRYFQFPNVEGYFLLCVHYKLWAEFGKTPIWLGIKSTVPIDRSKLRDSFSLLSEEVFIDYRFVPLRLPTGVEYEVVLSDIACQVKSARAFAIKSPI